MWPFKSKPKPQPLRSGIMEPQFTGTGLLNKGSMYQPVIEVVEWETLDDKSLISVTRITGHGGNERQMRELIPRWVPTSSVRWRKEA